MKFRTIILDVRRRYLYDIERPIFEVIVIGSDWDRSNFLIWIQEYLVGRWTHEELYNGYVSMFSLWNRTDVMLIKLTY